MSTTRTEPRTVYVRRKPPHTVHELDCRALMRMVDALSPAQGRKNKVTLEKYDVMKATDVPIEYPRCRVCAPGVL